ncbi:MAG: hypothetical protein AAF074_17030 [Pseudomonadota bacterium]
MGQSGRLPAPVWDDFYDIDTWRWRVIFQLLAHIVPSTEGDGVFDRWIASHSGLERDRALVLAGQKKAYTTCNMLMETVLSRLPVPRDLQRPTFMLEAVARKHGCWVENTGQVLPKAGDCLVLKHSPNGQQAHVCVAATAWGGRMVTADAGQNGGAKAGIPIQAARWIHRTYDSRSRCFTAARIDGSSQVVTGSRFLAGWVDLDLAMARGGTPFRTHWPVGF